MHIAFSGAAGTGIYTLGVLFGKYLSSRGYVVLGDREYASTIRGENTVFFLSFLPSGEFPVLSRYVDVFFSLDRFGVEKNQNIYRLAQVHIMDKALPYKHRNMYLLGQAIRYIGHDLADFERFLASEALWALNSDNIEPLRAGFASIEPSVYLPSQIGVRRCFLSGNEVLMR